MRINSKDASTGYRTAPEPRTTMPPGIPYIVGNEAAERFSYYGMTAVLMFFMTHGLRTAAGEPDVMNEAEATRWLHLFIMAVYILPLFGALLADVLLGKYRTILSLSIVYCLGHAVLAIDQTRWSLCLGLGLIALGAGGIKPCVSAHVGDQFGQSNQHLLERVFGWFYFAINLGSAASSYLTPELRERYGFDVAFGVPGVLMLLATIVFWMGRYKFVHVPPGGQRFLRETFSGEGLRAVARLLSIYVCVSMFFCLFDQTHSRWVSQAEHMDRNFGGWVVKPDQMQTVNPLLIMAFIPLFAYVIYPAINKLFRLTPLRKIGIGLFVTVGSYVVVSWIQQRIDAGETPHVAWQAAAYVVLTAAEVMVSITALEFSYTQAPRTMKSLIMALFLASISLGNLFTSEVNRYIENHPDTSGLEGANYYWFFTASMTVVAILYIVIAMRFQPRTYIQLEQPA